MGGNGRSGRARIAPMALVGFAALASTALVPAAGSAQTPDPEARQSVARRITVTWTAVPIRDVLMAFSAFSGKSIVAGASVEGSVTASISDRPWDVALQAILATQGLVAVEDEYGIIRVDDIGTLDAREAIEPILTRSYRISFVTVQEIEAALSPLLSPRGNISVSPSTNSVIVSDIARVHRAIAGVVRRP